MPRKVFPRKLLDLENIIRTETVLGRFPFHNLSKSETLEILIEEELRDRQPASAPANGAPRAQRVARRLAKYKTFWKVSPNMEFGAPGQLAYDIDKLIIDRALDQVGRPLPKWIRIGTLRSICRELGRSADTNAIRQALLQNSAAYVTLKLTYFDTGRRKHSVADHNTRYGLRFTGEPNEDGDPSEAVYISFNEPFRTILNRTKTRPVDPIYMRTLRPAARRFYELISYVFYGVFKRNQAYGQARYSEYCRFAPQKRLTDRHRAQTQMGKLHRIHKETGYLSKVQYVATTDLEGHRDWIMRYWPGPAAREEYEAFNPLRTRMSGDGGCRPRGPDESPGVAGGESEPWSVSLARQARHFQEDAFHDAAQAWAEAHFPQLPEEVQDRLVDEAGQRIIDRFPEENLRRAFGGDFPAGLRASARAAAIRRHQEKFPITLEEWKRGVRTADTGTTN